MRERKKRKKESRKEKEKKRTWEKKKKEKKQKAFDALYVSVFIISSKFVCKKQTD